MGLGLVSRAGQACRQARACTVAPKPGVFPPSSSPSLPIPTASQLSSFSKRWPCEVEMGE
jgi:hypothetical protein